MPRNINTLSAIISPKSLSKRRDIPKCRTMTILRDKNSKNLIIKIN